MEVWAMEVWAMENVAILAPAAKWWPRTKSLF